MLFKPYTMYKSIRFYSINIQINRYDKSNAFLYYKNLKIIPLLFLSYAMILAQTIVINSSWN